LPETSTSQSNSEGRAQRMKNALRLKRVKTTGRRAISPITGKGWCVRWPKGGKKKETSDRGWWGRITTPTKGVATMQKHSKKNQSHDAPEKDTNCGSEWETQ